MRVVSAEIPDVLVIEPDVHRDARGLFVETYHAGRYRDAGIPDLFVQDNQARSARRTLRGLHLQGRQAKLVRAVSGEVYDVAVDLRRGSPTFGRWVGVILSGDNFKQCFVPAGFAHGYCVLSETAEVAYKCSELYDPAAELAVAWDDPQLAIRWPVNDPLLSDRDRRSPTVAEVLDKLPS